MISISNSIQRNQNITLSIIFLLSFPVKIICYLNSPFLLHNTILGQRNNDILTTTTTNNGILHPGLSSSLAYQDERHSSNKRSRSSNNNSLEKRMRNIYRQDQRKVSERRHSVVKVVHTMEEFQNVVAEEKNKIVIVRFYANWCKACKATTPFYYSLANKKDSNICFVDVPITDKNVDLHQGLNIPSIPYGHIYNPYVGLVEEFRMTKKGAFRNHKVEVILSWYSQGFCNLLIDDDDDDNVDFCSSPYCDIDNDDMYSSSKLGSKS